MFIPQLIATSLGLLVSNSPYTTFEFYPLESFSKTSNLHEYYYEGLQPFDSVRLVYFTGDDTYVPLLSYCFQYDSGDKELFSSIETYSVYNLGITINYEFDELSSGETTFQSDYINLMYNHTGLSVNHTLVNSTDTQVYDSSQHVTFYITWYDQATFNAMNEGYNQGYYDGYNQGYQEGKSNGYQDGKSVGYNEGYLDGFQDGVASVDTTAIRNTGYQEGYRDGQSAVVADYGFMSLFASIADTPILMMRKLFDFSIFGTSMLALVLSLLTAIILIHVIKKVIK